MLSLTPLLNEETLVPFLRSIGYSELVDFVHPVQAIIPGAQGRILGVLAQVSTDLNLRTIARLSGLSPAQVSRILPKLVDLGVVDRRDVPPAALFRLVEDHVAVRAVLVLARARDAVVSELRRTAAQVSPAPTSITIFGSFARGVATADSDLDVLVVRPASTGWEDEDWASSIEHWRQGAGRLTGNRVEVIEVGEEEAVGLVQSRRSLWRDVVDHGITIWGKPLAEVGMARSA
jgi:DNA-binding transcriptional ArsR family regulator